MFRIFKRQAEQEAQRYAEELARRNDAKEKKIRLLEELLKNKQIREDWQRILSEEQQSAR